jgi:hypothetical protein
MPLGFPYPGYPTADAAAIPYFCFPTPSRPLQLAAFDFTTYAFFSSSLRLLFLSHAFALDIFYSTQHAHPRV